MAKSVTIGQMHTRIRIYSQTKGIDEDGFQTETWTNIFATKSGEDPFCWCNWVNLHGTEVLDMLRLEIKDAATITMRYTPKLTEECRVKHENDTELYEVISIDNVTDSRNLMEVKVRRMVTA